jgi:hypothetical protein
MADEQVRSLKLTPMPKIKILVATMSAIESAYMTRITKSC